MKKPILKKRMLVLLMLIFGLLSFPVQAQTYLGSWDLDGSGTTQAVYHSSVRAGVTKISVVKGSSTYDYFIETFGLGIAGL